MIEGHPYYTEEVDLLRAKHRRLLDAIPGRVSGSVRPPVHPDPTDRIETEVALRHFIESLLSRSDDASALVRLDEADRLREFAGHLPAVGVWEELIDSIERNRAEADASVKARVEQLKLLFILLSWAEELAKEPDVVPLVARV